MGVGVDPGGHARQPTEAAAAADVGGPGGAEGGGRGSEEQPGQRQGQPEQGPGQPLRRADPDSLQAEALLGVAEALLRSIPAASTSTRRGPDTSSVVAKYHGSSGGFRRLARRPGTRQQEGGVDHDLAGMAVDEREPHPGVPPHLPPRRPFAPQLPAAPVGFGQPGTPADADHEIDAPQPPPREEPAARKPAVGQHDRVRAGRQGVKDKPQSARSSSAFWLSFRW